MIINSRQGLSRNKISNFSEINSWKHLSGSAIILVPTVICLQLQVWMARENHSQEGTIHSQILTIHAADIVRKSSLPDSYLNRCHEGKRVNLQFHKWGSVGCKDYRTLSWAHRGITTAIAGNFLSQGKVARNFLIKKPNLGQKIKSIAFLGSSAFLQHAS